MTPQELADHVAAVVKEAQDRVGPDSIGARQYAVQGQPQKFETMTLDGLLDYAIEEQLDAINYAVMLVIRYRRVQQAIRDSAIKDAGRMLANAVCPQCNGEKWVKTFGGLNGEISPCSFCRGTGWVVRWPEPEPFTV